MKKFKVMLAIALVAVMAMTMSMVSFAAGSPIKIQLDGNTLTSDAAPVNESGRILVPIRVVAENLGGVVEFDSKTSIAKIVSADHTISLKVNSTTATVDGKSVTLDVPARVLESSRLFVPTRFVAENLGATVAWDAASSTVKITYFSGLTGTLKNGGSTTIQPFAQHAADALNKVNPSFVVTVTGGGSGVGISGADDGTLNIGNDSSAWSASDKAAHPSIVPIQVGNDAVAVIVNNVNTVKNLTQQQVKDIFTGKIVNWKDVGGSNAAILVNTRETGSGTLDCFSKKALGGDKVVSTAIPNDSNELMIQAVKANTNAIGFASLGYVADETSVSAIKVDGIQCTVANAYAGVWPYLRPLIVLTKGTPTGNTAKFINFMRSIQGQKILTGDHYLPLVDKYLKY